MIGTILSNYRIISELGHGGMGVVYEAEDLRLGRLVAIKILPVLTSRDRTARARFENEARAASALDHPNICTIHEIAEDEQGRLYIAMARYEGQTLEERMQAGRVELADAVRIIRNIATGLAAAHRAGIIHRDVKPGNVMLTRDGRVIILDFGLAKIDDVNITQEGQSVGTVTYMSPEQARGTPLDGRSDIWSLGVLGYELLTGVKPFSADYAQALLYMIVNEDPTPVKELSPDVPAALAELIDSCLEKDPENRISSMDEFLDRLAGAVDAPGTVTTTVERSWPHVAGWSAAIVLGLALVLVVVSPGVRNVISNSALFGNLPAERHLAVLTVPDSDVDEDRSALEAGFAETLTETLKRIESDYEDFWVVPGSRVRSTQTMYPEEAQEALGVNLVLTVDLVDVEEDLRLDLELVEAGAGRVLRQRSLMGDRSNLNALRSDMIESASELLNVEIGPGVNRFLRLTESTRPGAFEYYTQGLGYLNRFSEGNNLDASIILFRRSISADSSHAPAYAGLCAAYWRMWERNEDPSYVSLAEQNCERALELQADLGSAYVTLGRLHVGTGRYGTAIGEFKLALAQDPTDAEALIGLATAYDELDRLEDAEKTYKEAIALKPDYWFGYSTLGVFYFNQARYEEAVEQFEIVADLNPFNARAYANIGAIYFYLDRRREAIDMFELALEIKDDFAAWSNLATLYYYEGMYAESAQAFERALAMSDGGSYDTWGYLATAYKWSGQPEKARVADLQAIRLATQALEINPRDQEIMGHLATYHASVGHADSSRIFLDRLIALNPSDPQEMSRIGEAYELLGNRAAAIDWTAKALENGYALAEIVDYPGFRDLLDDPDFQRILEQHSDSDASDVLQDETN